MIRKNKPTAKILRDAYGVPHIYGESDADVVFSFMYAQAEDNFPQIEEDLIHFLGFTSEIYGETFFLNDWLRRAFQIETLAKLKYKNSEPEIKKLCDAYSDGLNYFLQANPQVKPKLINRFKPWHIFVRTGPTVAALNKLGLETEEIRAALRFTKLGERDFTLNADIAGIDETGGDAPGSNIWALSPSKSLSGNPILVIDSHTPFFGIGQRYEAHLHSREGLNVQGFSILGTPYIRSGHNGKIAWGHSNNNSRTTDVYIEDVVKTKESYLYKFNGEYYKMPRWKTVIKVKKEGSTETENFKMAKTRHGPIVAIRNNRFISVRVAKIEEDEFCQRWKMCKAESVSDFKQTMTDPSFVGSNTICADRRGNIFYLHGSATPRRTPAIDWKKTLEASDPKSEWNGYHSLEELPQITNPPSGWLQNCNSTVFFASGDTAALEKKFYPEYMIGEPDSARAENLRRILQKNGKLSREDALKAATDVFVIEAEKLIPQLLRDLENEKEVVASRFPISEAARLLQQWDCRSTSDSVAMTLFIFWYQRVYSARNGDPAYRIYNSATGLRDAFVDALDELVKTFGTWEVAWGEVNRLQRIDTLNGEKFAENLPSLPAIGGWATAGVLFAFYSSPVAGSRQRFGTFGSSFTCVIELGTPIRYFSIVPFGQSADRSSPHYFDQAPLYAAGRLKVGLFDLSEIEEKAEKIYCP